MPSTRPLGPSTSALLAIPPRSTPPSSLPSRGKRVLASDVAKSVNWMVHRSGHYGFLRELFKLVFGFHPEEAESRKNVSIAV